MATLVGNFFGDFWVSFTNGLSDLGDNIEGFFTSLGTNIGGFFNGLWNNIADFFADLPQNISNIWNNFVELLQYINPWSDKFFLKIAFVLSEEQEAKHSTAHQDLNDALSDKFPAVSLLIQQFEELQESQENVRKTKSFNNSSSVISRSPLNLEISNFSYDGGVIHYEAEGTDLTFILEAYEPYRIPIRNALMLLGYGMGIVYLVKHFLNYGATSAVSSGIDIASKGD